MGTALISRLAGVGITGLLACSSARAELSLGVEAGAGYTDNIRRVEHGKDDEKIGVLGVDLSWSEKTRRVEGDALIDLSYNEYLDDTYDGEVLGTADGTLTIGIIPERLAWLFQDSFGQVQSDPFAPVTPETRENLNYFTTGPSLSMRLGSAASMQIFGRYALSSYEDSPLDSKQTSGGLGLFRELSSRSTVGLNVSVERVRYDDTPESDFDREGAFLSYALNGARTEISTELGYSRLKPESGDTDGGLYASISLSRTLSSSSTLYVDAGRQFTDSGEALRSSIEGGSIGDASVTATDDPFENTYAGVRWAFVRHRTGLNLGVRWEQDRYEVQTLLDRTRVAYDAGVSRRLGPTLDLGLNVSLNDEEFDNTNFDSKELIVRGNLSWQAGRRLGLTLSLERHDRSASDASDYKENRVFLTLNYRPIAAPTPGAGRAAR